MQRVVLPKNYPLIADLVVLGVLASGIYGVVLMAQEWQSSFVPATEIDLSAWALPRYAVLSALRGLIAYFISLTFTFVVGYAAAKSKRAESILLPLLDILQSIPVLGFLPGIVLGMISLFPETNTGLELAAILMIFTGQVWNMTFSFYASLKAIPGDFKDAANVMNLSWYQRFTKVELPYAGVNLAWNSVLSMAGGWFFLSVCEAFTLGMNEYRLPGLGAYMAVAIREGHTQAILMGIGAMATLIVIMDLVIWRPVLAWVQRFTVEESEATPTTDPLMRIMIQESWLIRWMKLTYRRYFGPHRKNLDFHPAHAIQQTLALKVAAPVRKLKSRSGYPVVIRALEWLVTSLFMALIVWCLLRMIGILSEVSYSSWVMILRNTVWTFLRITIAIALSTLWAVPVGIWIGTSSRRVRAAQPIIQVLASFPAPMVYPLVISFFFWLGLDFDFCSSFLIMMGVQWYVLFNVLAGAVRIPSELRYALELMKASRKTFWTKLYLPAIYPSLVTGWVTAAGGAWNASFIAEYLSYQGQILTTGGLGATINRSAESGDFPVFAASLMVLVVVVVVLNRTIWAKAYQLAETRFRPE